MNVKALFEAYSQLMQNPTQFLQKMNIPVEYANDPNGAIQYLMNKGKISQEQYNNANNQLSLIVSTYPFSHFEMVPFDTPII